MQTLKDHLQGLALRPQSPSFGRLRQRHPVGFTSSPAVIPGTQILFSKVILKTKLNCYHATVSHKHISTNLRQPLLHADPLTHHSPPSQAFLTAAILSAKSA